MICLGIESTAHTFSCAIVEKRGNKGKILSDVRRIYRPQDGQGIHPREASRHHIEHSSEVLSECVRQANLSIKDIDLISYSAGPGLGPCLRVSGVVARTISSYYKIPIYPVNHAICHIELGKMLTGAKDPLTLLVGPISTATKTLALALGAVIGGLAGGLYAHLHFIIAPREFGFSMAVDLLVFNIVGGTRRWYGPLLGTVLLTALPEVLRGVGVTAGPLRMFVNGLIMLLVILFLPNGLISLFQPREKAANTSKTAAPARNV